MKDTTILERAHRKTVDLRQYMRSAKHPILCMGPMSKNTVDAVITFANRIQMPIPLIASRRQIESEEFGGGYVNGWNTRTFSEYVRARDKGFVLLCRDHGGPWQGEGEATLDQPAAMARARRAFLDDIANGFDVLHLDPSLQGGNLTDPQVLNMLFELYAFVCDTAQQTGAPIEIEVGTEQQSGMFSDARELVTFLKTITTFCEKHHYQKPLFCVVQTGTLVKEMRNVGFTEGRKNESFDQKYAVETMEKTVKYLSDIACINGVFVKEHNGDYLSDGSMALRRKLEIGGVNVAPELGVSESKALISTCIELGLKREAEAILEIFYSSNKWVKWLSAESQATDFDKAIIAGHYTFAKPEFIEIKARVSEHAARKQIDLDAVLVQGLIGQLNLMTWNLGYFHSLGLMDSTAPRAQGDIPTVHTNVAP